LRLAQGLAEPGRQFTIVFDQQNPHGPLYNNHYPLRVVLFRIGELALRKQGFWKVKLITTII
jgi:hypothetical protein